MKEISYRKMRIEDYDEIRVLWEMTEGLRLRGVDSRKGIERYLLRNPETSFVALEEEKIVGTVLAGHDGRRGYLQHLTVVASHRRRGIGSRLVALVIEALKKEGICKMHLFVLNGNEVAQKFWSDLGGELRDPWYWRASRPGSLWSASR